MVAKKYLYLVKECSKIKAYYQGGTLSADKLRERLENLAQKYELITEDATCLSMDRKDYEIAREGFEDGEERYSQEEDQEE